MAFESSGKLNLDLLRIEVDQIGQDAYDTLPPDAVTKMIKKADDMATAIKAWMGRQELKITEMDAPVMIPKRNPWIGGRYNQVLLQPRQVKVQGSAAAQQNLGNIDVKTEIYGRAQLTQGRKGRKIVPQSEANVLTSKVEALEPKD
tara:strand:- start:414 stop:851 length:438 start_codon:yes stop_codon:yes gene_type:complete